MLANTTIPGQLVELLLAHGADINKVQYCIVECSRAARLKLACGQPHQSWRLCDTPLLSLYREHSPPSIQPVSEAIWRWSIRLSLDLLSKQVPLIIILYCLDITLSVSLIYIPPLKILQYSKVMAVPLIIIPLVNINSSVFVSNNLMIKQLINA